MLFIKSGSFWYQVTFYWQTYPSTGLEPSKENCDREDDGTVLAENIGQTSVWPIKNNEEANVNENNNDIIMKRQWENVLKNAHITVVMIYQSYKSFRLYMACDHKKLREKNNNGT